MSIVCKFFYCFLLLTIPLSLYSESDWSHLENIATDPDGYIAKWIVDGKPINYCIFLEDGAKITKESASIQVRSAIKNWLKSISFYYPKNRVYWRDGTEINLNAITINELNCSLILSSEEKNYSIKASDVNKRVLPAKSYVSVFFSMKEGRSYHIQSPNITGFKAKNTTGECSIKSDAVQPIIMIYTGSEIDTLFYTKKEYKQNLQDLLTIQVPNKLSVVMQTEKNYIYSSYKFCVDYGINCSKYSSSSFETVLHEMGHTFGLGDEYAEGGALAGTQSYNDTNFMSGSTNPSTMKDCDTLFPTKDDVVGLTYLFDRLVKRDLSKRTFKFEDYPSSKYAFAPDAVTLVNEDGEKVVEKKQEEQTVSEKKNEIDNKNQASASTQELRKKKVIDVELGSDSNWLTIIGVSSDDLKTRIVPKLIDQDAKLRMKPKNEWGETPVFSDLAISNSTLEVLPPDISKLTGLRRLDLSANQFSVLPTEVTTFKGLEKLNISFNKLSSLPSSILNLRDLTSLDIGRNNFKTFPVVVTMMTGLTDISMDGSNLSSLPPDVYKLSKLERLSLENNNFNSIPLDLSRFPNLSYLNLKKNPIKLITPNQAKSMSHIGIVLIDVENLDATSQNLLKGLMDAKIINPD